MKSSANVVMALQDCLALHWSAMETYRAQCVHFKRNGYSALAKSAEDDVKEESEHADRILLRLEELDAEIVYEHEEPQWPELPDFKGLLEANLELEKSACDCERNTIKLARSEGDDRTANLISQNLEGSEESIVAIEAALRQIELIGLDNYLADKL